VPCHTPVIYGSDLRVVASGDYVIDNVGDAKRVYTSEEFYDPAKLLKSDRIINRALHLAVARWYPTLLSLSEFTVPSHSIFKSDEVFEAVYCDQHNPFREVFREHFLNSILEEKPDLVGISIAGWGQIIPGLTLASLIKEAASDIHVCIGGQIPSRWEDALPQLDNFFRFFDSVIVREGEIPLLSLATALEKGRDLEEVPNLIYWDGKQTRVNPVTEMVDIDSLPTPSFDGFPLDSYLFPELILPLFTQRGCYWKKCAFCDHWYGFENYHVARDLDLVIEDIRQLSTEYQTRLFSFSDENTLPQRMKEFSKGVLEAGLDVKWLLPGTSVGVNETILKNFAKAGIWNYVAIVLGFPSEERKEAEETIEHLASHTNFIKGVFDNVFTLVPWSVVAHEPERFNVTKIEDDTQDLALFHIYYPSSGMSYKEARTMQTTLLDRLRKAHPNFEFWHTLTWFHTFLYLIRKGYAAVSGMRVGTGWLQKPSDGWEDVIVNLRDGVFQITRLFDRAHVAAGIVERGEYHSLYDLFADKFFSISLNAKRLLDHCSQGRGLGDLILQVSASTEIPVEKVKMGYVDFVKNLEERNLVVCERLGSIGDAQGGDQ